MYCMMDSGLRETALQWSWCCLVAVLADRCKTRVCTGNTLIFDVESEILILNSKRRRQIQPNPYLGTSKTLNSSVLQKWQMSGEMFLHPKVLPGGRVLLCKFHTLTSSIVEIISLTFF